MSLCSLAVHDAAIDLDAFPLPEIMGKLTDRQTKVDELKEKMERSLCRALGR